MSVPVVASAHYGDFKGTVSIDQADGKDLLRLLAEKVKMPKEYCPVGFSVGVAGGGGLPGHSFYLTVYATDSQVVMTEIGEKLDEYLRQHPSVPVFQFRKSMKGTALAKLLLSGIKILDVVAQARQLRDRPMALLEPH